MTEPILDLTCLVLFNCGWIYHEHFVILLQIYYLVMPTRYSLRDLLKWLLNHLSTLLNACLFFTLRCVFFALDQNFRFNSNTGSTEWRQTSKYFKHMYHQSAKLRRFRLCIYVYMYMEEFDIPWYICRQRIYHQLYLHIFIQFLHSCKCKQENNFLVFIPRY